MSGDRLGNCIPGVMAEASLTISSKNYSSWSLRGFLLCRMAGLAFAERVAPIDDPATRAELLLLSPSFPAARAHCRAVCGEMHSGFAILRSALPMNLKAIHPGFKVWAGAQADID